jgi:hypothetical protein
MWENIVELDRPQMTVWRMRIPCRIPKAANTHSEYVTPIAHLRQNWLCERDSVLDYTYLACIMLTEKSVKWIYSYIRQTQHYLYIWVFNDLQ